MLRVSQAVRTSNNISDCSRVCLVHYHEIGLKGRNRSTFERRLIDNITALLKKHKVEIQRISGRILVTILDDEAFADVEAALVRVPGIVRVSSGWRIPRDMEGICERALLALEECEPYTTFKVDARRSNTDFPIHSQEMNQIVGAFLCEHLPEKVVKMKDPDVKVHVEVIQGSVYVYARSVTAIGGLPVGSAGKVVSLMSSGIDSPVATARLIKRGAVAIGLHFSGRPQTADTSEYLVRELAEVLSASQGLARVYIVPFGDYQRAIAGMVSPDLRIIFYRRLMFLIAERIAHIEGAKALVTGESLGQVASQTLENIMAVDEVVGMPVFRPLIGTDKQEIIAEAKRLGTFEISTQDAADCCTLFMPRNPETHARLDIVHREWERLPLDEWIAEIVEALEYFDCPCPAYHDKKSQRKPRKPRCD